MKNLVIVSFPAKEEKLDILKNAMKDALPETRAYDGCISVDTYIEESTNTIHLIEDWESLDHQAKYLNWRIETGLLTALDPILDGGASSIKVLFLYFEIDFIKNILSSSSIKQVSGLSFVKSINIKPEPCIPPAIT